MQIYLPIAEVAVNAFTLIGLGGVVGLMSGLFGVGGGFLITPLLFFIGIPPAIAVATGANQVVASSFSGVLAHVKRKSVDFRMGWVLLAGGLVGSSLGVLLFNLLQRLGQVDLVVHLQKLTGKKIKPEEFKSVRSVADVVEAVDRLMNHG